MGKNDKKMYFGAFRYLETNKYVPTFGLIWFIEEGVDDYNRFLNLSVQNGIRWDGRSMKPGQTQASLRKDLEKTAAGILTDAGTPVQVPAKPVPLSQLLEGLRKAGVFSDNPDLGPGGFQPPLAPPPLLVPEDQDRLAKVQARALRTGAGGSTDSPTPSSRGQAQPTSYPEQGTLQPQPVLPATSALVLPPGPPLAPTSAAQLPPGPSGPTIPPSGSQLLSSQPPSQTSPVPTVTPPPPGTDDSTPSIPAALSQLLSENVSLKSSNGEWMGKCRDLQHKIVMYETQAAAHPQQIAKNILPDLEVGLRASLQDLLTQCKLDLTTDLRGELALMKEETSAGQSGLTSLHKKVDKLASEFMTLGKVVTETKVLVSEMLGTVAQIRQSQGPCPAACPPGQSSDDSGIDLDRLFPFPPAAPTPSGSQSTPSSVATYQDNPYQGPPVYKPPPTDTLPAPSVVPNLPVSTSLPAQSLPTVPSPQIPSGSSTTGLPNSHLSTMDQKPVLGSATISAAPTSSTQTTDVPGQLQLSTPYSVPPLPLPAAHHYQIPHCSVPATTTVPPSHTGTLDPMLSTSSVPQPPLAPHYQLPPGSLPAPTPLPHNSTPDLVHHAGASTNPADVTLNPQATTGSGQLAQQSSQFSRPTNQLPPPTQFAHPATHTLGPGSTPYPAFAPQSQMIAKVVAEPNPLPYPAQPTYPAPPVFSSALPAGTSAPPTNIPSSSYFVHPGQVNQDSAATHFLGSCHTPPYYSGDQWNDNPKSKRGRAEDCDADRRAERDPRTRGIDRGADRVLDRAGDRGLDRGAGRGTDRAGDRAADRSGDRVADRGDREGDRNGDRRGEWQSRSEERPTVTRPIDNGNRGGGDQSKPVARKVLGPFFCGRCLSTNHDARGCRAIQHDCQVCMGRNRPDLARGHTAEVHKVTNATKRAAILTVLPPTAFKEWF